MPCLPAAVAAAGLPAGAAAWLVLGWLAVVLLVLPVLGRPRIEEPEGIRRGVLYAAVILSLLFVAALTALAAWGGGMGPRELGLALPAPRSFLAWSGGTLAAGLAIAGALLALQARAGAREPRVLVHLMPVTRRERWLFVGVALAAGGCEEWVFRGFALAALDRLTGDAVAAALIQAVSFGLVHGYQSGWGRLRATLMGVVLAGPPVFAGSILPSIAAHAALDLAAAFVLWPRFASRLSPAQEAAVSGGEG